MAAQEIRRGMRLFVDIRDDLMPVLAQLAQQHKRQPKDQAAWLIEKALEEWRDKVQWDTSPVPPVE